MEFPLFPAERYDERLRATDSLVQWSGNEIPRQPL